MSESKSQLAGYEIEPGEVDVPMLDTPMELETCSFAKSEAAKYPHGVDYRGAYETEWAGVQTSVRRHARALSKTGMPVWLMSHGHRLQYRDPRGNLVDGFADHTAVSDAVLGEVGHLLDRKHAQSLVCIEHRVFSPEAVTSVAYPVKLGRLGPNFRARVNATTVLYTVFERSCPDEDIKRSVFAMGNLGEVWVPCRRNRNVLIQAGLDPEKVVRVPHPVPASDPVWKMRARKRGDAQVRFIHVGKWEPRKAQHEMIGAFLQAFAPGEAELVLKYSDFGTWKDYPVSPQASVGEWLETSEVRQRGWSPHNIGSALRFYSKPLPREILLRFLAESDVYVSSGRVEGFDMPALDAKILGLRLMVMGHGGAEDFVSKGDAIFVSGEVDAHPGYGWNGAKWAGFDVKRFVSAFAAFARYHLSPETGDVADFDPFPYTEEVVGQLMLSRVMGIVKSLEGKCDFQPVQEYLNA